MLLDRRAPLVVLGLGLASADCATIEPIEAAAGCPERPVRVAAPIEAATDLIDDFEHEGNALPRLGGRNGMWAVGSDGSTDELEAGTSSRCSIPGQRAGHFAGSGFSGWGANWTALLRNQAGGATAQFDARDYKGISFWAAVSSGVPAPYALQVGVTTPPPNSTWNGVVCPSCMGYYVSEISLDHRWQRFELRFAELEQFDNGNPPAPLRLETLVGLTFWPRGDFDIWLDDVRFER